MSGTNSRMKPPFYIVARKDNNYGKIYHTSSPKGIAEQDYSPSFCSGKRGPRRMRHIDTAFSFREKISKELEIPKEELKVIVVQKYIKTAMTKLKNDELEAVPCTEIFWK